MRIALVYQAGIANVFAVNQFGTVSIDRRATTRLLQHAFLPCEYFVRGMATAGCDIRIYSCNRAGDIAECDWTQDMDDCPFRESANPPSIKKGKA